MSDHARLAPSASSRWLTCPGSVSLIEQFSSLFTETENEAAARGTEAHELAEKVLKQAPANFDKSFVETARYKELLGDADEWLVEMVTPYVTYLAEVPGTKSYENRVFIDEHCWGTADCLSYHDAESTLHVIDLKTGRIRVDAPNNTQLLLYALGAFIGAAKAGYVFSKFKLAIVQPSLNHISEWEIDDNILNDFSVQYEEAVQKILTETKTYNVSEKACHWCEAKIVCPAFKKHIDEFAIAEFSAQMLDEELAYWLDRLPALKSLINAVETEAKNRMTNFREIPGYDLSAPRRTFTYNEDKLLEIGKARGLMNVLFPRVPISPAQAKKLNLSKPIERLLDSAVEVKLGNPSIIKLK